MRAVRFAKKIGIREIAADTLEAEQAASLRRRTNAMRGTKDVKTLSEQIEVTESKGFHPFAT
jgi:hypothetical protein